MTRTQKLQHDGALDLLTKLQKDMESNRLDSTAVIAELAKGIDYLQLALDKFITADPGMIKVKQRVAALFPRPEPVLITGPTGTGKELLAKALKRPGEPFVAVNCGGMLNRELLPSLFFGHKKGAFTGAHEDRKGYLESAGEGIIFLDEIGDLDLPLQAALLRAIQENEIIPVGSVECRDIECRFVAATKFNLEDRVEKGFFREDLYARLSVFELHVTGLKDRPCDIPLIRDSLVVTDPENPLPEFPESVVARINKYNVRAIETAIARWRAYGSYE